MNYLNPMSVSVSFYVEINGKNVQPFIDIIKGILFEKFEINYIREKQSAITITLSTTIKGNSPKVVCFGYIDRFEKRLRADFMKRISGFNQMVISIKETTNIKFISKPYPISKKSKK